MNRLLNRPNRHRPSAPVGRQRCLTLKSYSEWSPTATWNIKCMLLYQNKTFTLGACIHSSCLRQNWWIYIISMHMHSFRSHMALSALRFYCFLQCCGSLFYPMWAPCFYCVYAVHHTVLLITYSYWKLITHYADCIFRHLNQIAFAHLHHECLTN